MTKILKDIGQCSVISEGVEYVFTPSFVNLAQLGSGADIVKKYSAIAGVVSSNDPQSLMLRAELFSFHNPMIKKIKVTRYAMVALECAIECLEAMCDKRLPDKMIGRLDYINGANWYCLSDSKYGMPIKDIFIIAWSLLTKGLIGKPDSRGSESDGSGEFKVSSFINFAVAHFGLSKEDAKNLTMVEFQELYDMKFPEIKQAKEDKAKDAKDKESAIDFYEMVEQLRNAQEE